MVMPHGHHIYAKSSDTAKATTSAYPYTDDSLPHCKYVMKCCPKCPSINLPDQETDDQYYDTSPSISFHIYHLIVCCSTHGRIPLNEKKYRKYK